MTLAKSSRAYYNMDMVNKSKIQTKTITIDMARSAPRNVDEGGIVLLYDDRRGCYYETTVKSIAASFISELRKVESDMKRSYAALEAETKAKYDALEKELREQQKRFISDTANATDKLINLVEANEK